MEAGHGLDSMTSVTSSVSVLNLSGFICLPSPESHWFQGRIMSKGTSLSLIGVDQSNQHPCLTPADGSFVFVDVGVLDLENGCEAVICDVEKTGGSLCALNAGVVTHSSLFSFSPRSCSFDEVGVRLAHTLFPDIPLLPDSDVVVVEGSFSLNLSDLHWCPLTIRDDPDVGHNDGITKVTVAKMLARRWDTEVTGDGVHLCSAE